MPGIQDRVRFFNDVVAQQAQAAARVYRSVPPIWLLAPAGEELTPVQQEASTGISRDGPPPLVQAVLDDDELKFTESMVSYEQAIRAQHPAYTDGQVRHELCSIVNGRWKHYRLAHAAAVHEAQQRKKQRRRLLQQQQWEAGEELETYAVRQALLDSCEYMEVSETAERLNLRPGTTLLVLAASLARPEAVMALLAHGADPSLLENADAADCASCGGILGTEFIAITDGRRLGWVGATQHELEERRTAVQKWFRKHANLGLAQFSLLHDPLQLQYILLHGLSGLSPLQLFVRLWEDVQAAQAKVRQDTAFSSQPASIDSASDPKPSMPSTPQPGEKASPVLAGSPLDPQSRQEAWAPGRELGQQQELPLQSQLHLPSQQPASAPQLQQQQPTQQPLSPPQLPQQQRQQPQQVPTPVPVQQAQQLFSPEPPQHLQQPPQRMPSAARRQLRLADKGVLPPAASPEAAASAAPVPPQAGQPEEAVAAVASAHASAPETVGRSAPPSRSRSGNARMRRMLRMLNPDARHSLLFQAQLAKPAALGQRIDKQMTPADKVTEFSAAGPATTTAISTASDGEVADSWPAKSGSAIAAAALPELSAGARAAPSGSATTMSAELAAPVSIRQRQARSAAAADKLEVAAAGAVGSREEAAVQLGLEAASPLYQPLNSATNMLLLAVLLAWLLLPAVILMLW